MIKKLLPNPDVAKMADSEKAPKQGSRVQRLRSPLARKQLFYILFFSSIITLIGTSIQLYIEYQKDIGTIELQLDQVQKGYLRSLTSSLWKLDDDQLNIQLSNMLSMRDVERMEIYEGDTLTHSAGTEPEKSSEIRRTYEMVYTRSSGSTKIGTLHAIASLSGVYRRMGERLVIILTTQGIKTFLVSLFILAIIHYLVTRHLHTMAGHVRCHDPSRVGQPLTLTRRTATPDELDDLVGAINTLEIRLNEHIREQKRATDVLAESEERLRRSQALLKTVLSSLDEVVLLVEPQGRLIVDANATVSLIFGYQHNEVLGYGTDVLHVDDLQARQFEENVHNAFSKQGFFAGEFQMRRKDGEVFATEHYVTKIGGQQGTPELEVSIIRDISHRKILEARVQQAQKLEAVGTLTGGIAHDFNNLLGIIMGNAELAMEHICKPAPGHRHLEEIMAAGTRAKAVIGQLLNYGRETHHELVSVDLTQIVENTVKLLRPSIPQKINLHQHFDNEVWTVKAEPSQIHQVVLNLCTNACQAMESLGGRLTIRLKNKLLTHPEHHFYLNLPAGSYVQLTVSDTGEGIAAEHLDKVFDPYFTTKETGKGTGLGLAVVHGIVKNHQGAVALKSLPGEGTQVSVYLPAVDLPATSEAKPVKLNSSQLPKGSAKILILDDETQLVQMGKKMLQKLGYDVDSATRPEEAIGMIRSTSSRYDLLITDLNMPNMSGLELAARIHRMQPELPIVLCSGISTRVKPEDARAAGVKGLLAKPYDLKDLAKILSTVLSHGQIKSSS